MQQPAQWQLLSQGRELPEHGSGSAVKTAITYTMTETWPIFHSLIIDCLLAKSRKIEGALINIKETMHPDHTCVGIRLREEKKSLVA